MRTFEEFFVIIRILTAFFISIGFFDCTKKRKNKFMLKSFDFCPLICYNGVIQIVASNLHLGS